MNNLLVTIQKTELRFLFLVFLLAVVVGNSLNNTLFYAGIIFAVIIIAIIRFQFDKKWLKNADKYVRIKIKRSYWKSGLLLLASICIGYILQEALFQLKDTIREATIISWGTISIILSIGNYHYKFADSIKSFEDGIQLPGRQSELIPWKEIYSLEIKEKVFISSSKGEHEYDIDPDDFGFTREMISDWKSKNTRRN